MCCTSASWTTKKSSSRMASMYSLAATIGCGPTLLCMYSLAAAAAQSGPVLRSAAHTCVVHVSAL